MKFKDLFYDEGPFDDLQYFRLKLSVTSYSKVEGIILWLVDQDKPEVIDQFKKQLEIIFFLKDYSKQKYKMAEKYPNIFEDSNLVELWKDNYNKMKDMKREFHTWALLEVQKLGYIY